MERRRTTRREISANVYISCPGHAWRCKARNISADGVFVEVSPAALPPATSVEVVFVFYRGPLIRIHRLAAVVAHRAPTGAGLRLFKKPPRPYQCIGAPAAR